MHLYFAFSTINSNTGKGTINLCQNNFADLEIGFLVSRFVNNLNPTTVSQGSRIHAVLHRCCITKFYRIRIRIRNIQKMKRAWNNESIVRWIYWNIIIFTHILFISGYYLRISTKIPRNNIYCKVFCCHQNQNQSEHFLRSVMRSIHSGKIHQMCWLTLKLRNIKLEMRNIAIKMDWKTSEMVHVFQRTQSWSFNAQ
jgi:hypothetical protein